MARYIVVKDALKNLKNAYLPQSLSGTGMALTLRRPDTGAAFTSVGR